MIPSSSPSAAARPRAWALAAAAAALAGLGASACEALATVAVEAGDFAGAKTDVHCDRRIVADGGTPAAFCQEVIGTVAGAEFSDDCRAKHLAAAGPGRCPRERVIGGCRITKDNDDQSQVFDWYYDVSEPPDGGVRDAEAFENRVDGGGAIAAVCADRDRYEDGAEVARP